VLLLAVLLSGLASAQEPEVPDWAQDWKKTYLSAKTHGSLQLSGALTRKVLAPGEQELFAVLELSTIDFPPGEPTPASVAIIIDRSASTAGRRLLIAKKTALAILEGLTERDRLTILRVSNKAESLPLQPVTAENREKMKAFIEQTQAEGRSDLSAGLDAALEEFDTLPEGDFYRQVILLSDGQPTEGMVDGAGLAAIARDIRDARNVHVSTVAIGEDADLEVMSGMAKEGWGFASRLHDSSGAERVATRQRLELVRRAADKAILRVKLEPAVRVLAVLGNESTQKGNQLQLPLGELGAGEVMHVVLHLAVNAAGKQVRTLELAHIELQYENALTEHTRLQNITLEAELNPAKAKGPGNMNAEAARHAARAILTRNLARAEETAEDGDKAGAKQVLDESRTTLQKMSSQASFDATKELALLAERTEAISQKYALNKLGKQPAKKKKKKR
jgi:Ca-activated chloride channel family protein